MTKEEILNMECGEQLDKLVAEKVMKWTRKNIMPEFEDDLAWFNEGGLITYCDCEWIPSVDISTAWEVMQKHPITLVPIYYYEDYDRWNNSEGNPDCLMWGAIKFNDSIYKGESSPWVYLDDTVDPDLIFKTASEAICKTALLNALGL